MHLARLQATATGLSTWEELPVNIILAMNLFLAKMQIHGLQTLQRLSASLGIPHFTSFPGDYDVQ